MSHANLNLNIEIVPLLANNPGFPAERPSFSKYSSMSGKDVSLQSDCGGCMWLQIDHKITIGILNGLEVGFL